LEDLLLAGKKTKIPKYTYTIMMSDKNRPEKPKQFWDQSLSSDIDFDDWEEIHTRNFYCTIETRLRSFYFKFFHNAIAFNNFLYKINRKDSPNCSFCDKVSETSVHIFCDCQVVTPIWNKIHALIKNKVDDNINLSNFHKLFGYMEDPLLTYICLCTKFYIYRCKFSNEKPNYSALKSFLKSQRETEFYIAKAKGKLNLHYRKWRFDF